MLWRCWFRESGRRKRSDRRDGARLAANDRLRHAQKCHVFAEAQTIR